jgi:hypothetical protein
MEGGRPVKRYQVAARLRDGLVEWSFALETDDGERYVLPIRDGEEIPVLRDLCRRDPTVYFDPNSSTLRSGWNLPGRPEHEH